MDVFVIVGSGIVTACFVRLFYLKVKYPYEAKHFPDSVDRVHNDYHPSYNMQVIFDSPKYPGLWWGYTTQSIDYLFVPVTKLEQVTEERLEERLSNWNWLQYPTGEWPKIWNRKLEG